MPVNIFYVHTDPVIAAQSLVNTHCVKMCLETAQILSTAHRLLDGRQIPGKSKNGRNVKRYVLDDHRDGVVYQATHVNHPSTVWARTSVENYLWLVEHYYGLLGEYQHRYGKVHACNRIAYDLQSPPKNLTDYDMTVMPCAMDKQYIISDDPVVNYRNYYVNGKKHLHAYTNRQPPEWMNI
jgi:hypothetical protein